MKTFNANQKKWALTSSLVMALGFSLSMSTNIVAQGDFASLKETNSVDNDYHAGSDQGKNSENKATAVMSVNSAFKAATGDVKVTYVKTGDTTTAVVTEGTICTSCKEQNFKLSIPFKPDDIESMNLALTKFISSDASKEIAKDNTENADETDKASVDELNDKVLSTISSLCGDAADQDQLSCYTDHFNDLLNNKLSKDVVKVLKKDKEVSLQDLGAISKKSHEFELKNDFDKKTLTKFYKDNIAENIKTQVEEANNIKLLKIKAQRGDTEARDELSNMDSTDELVIQNKALGSLKDLIANIPKKYKDLRKEISVSQKDLIHKSATDFQTAYNTAMTTKDPAAFAQAKLESEVERYNLQTLMNNMVIKNNEGLKEANSAKLITATDLASYKAYLNSYAKSVTDGINMNPSSFVVPTADGSLDVNNLGRIALAGTAGTYANSSDFANVQAPASGGFVATTPVALTPEEKTIINQNRSAYGLPPIQ